MLFLARHGETPYNVQRRFQGQNDIGLTDRGVQQAHTLARTAATAEQSFAALRCSPLRRARQTADIVGAALGLTPNPDDRFKETDTGDWTDRLFADVEREDPDGYAAYHATDPDFRFPGGESLAQQSARVHAGLDAVRRAGPLPALIVCHRGVIRVVRSAADPRGLASFMSWDVPNGTLEGA